MRVAAVLKALNTHGGINEALFPGEVAPICGWKDRKCREVLNTLSTNTLKIIHGMGGLA